MAVFRRSVSSHVVAVSLALAATLAAARLTERRASDTLVAALGTIPLEIAGFNGIDQPPLEDNVARELNATSYLRRRYLKERVEADLFIAYYAQQRAGESMHSPKHCLPGGGWEIWNYDTLEIRAGSQQVRINKYSISNAGNRRVVLYWYQTRTEVFASEYLGKLLLARDALFRNSTAATIVRIIVPESAAAVQEAEAMASEMVLQVRRCLGE